MKRLLFTLLGTVFCLLCSAQTRTYSDNASGTFIFGLDSYFYGRTGSLEFEADGKTFLATVEGGDVYVNGTPLEGGRGEVVTGNRIPELAVARRNDSWVALSLYKLAAGDWIPAGHIDPVDGKEIRVFRQVVSVRDGDTLHSWTWHGNGFDYKSNK